MSRIRITGGTWRSRLLQVGNAPGLRPTPDRVRETLFNWLGHDLNGLGAIDLFAGTGILGLEAASRGAGPVDFVERDVRVRALLQRQIAALASAAAHESSPKLRLHGGDGLNFAPSEPADLLFLDPPYRQGLLDRVAPRLPLLLKDDGWLYVEAEAPLDALGAWRVVRRGQAGQVFFHLMEHE